MTDEPMTSGSRDSRGRRHV